MKKRDDLVKLINNLRKRLFMGVGGVYGDLSPHMPVPHHHVCGDGAWGSEKLKYVKWTNYLLQFLTVVMFWWLFVAFIIDNNTSVAKNQRISFTKYREMC